MSKPSSARSHATTIVAAALGLTFVGSFLWFGRSDPSSSSSSARVTPTFGDVARGSPTPTDVRPSRTWLTGRVFADLNGAPIVGARVSLSSLTANPRTPRRDVATSVTDADGAYTFEGGPDPDDLYAFVQVHCDGFAAQGIDPHDWEPENLTAETLLDHCVDARSPGTLPDARLEPALPIRGRVLMPSGAPASSGRVYAFCEGEGGEFSCEAPASAIAADGRFTVWATGARAILQAWVADAAPVCTPVVELAPALGASEVEILLRAEHEIATRVNDDAGRPIADACVRVRLASPLASPVVPFMRKWHSTRADVGGEYSIRGVPPGTVEIDAYHAEWLPDELRVTNPVEVVRPLVLRPASIVTVRFTHTVAPVIVFETQKQSVVLLRRGDLYQSLPLELESERGQILAPGYLPRLVAWQPGAGKHDLGTLTLDAGQDIEVHVRDSEQRAVSAAQVTCIQYCADELTLPDTPVKQSSSAETDASGNVRLGSFSFGEVDLFVACDGYCRERVRTEILDPSGGPLNITLTRAAAVRFRVLDPDGRPARGITANGEDEIGVTFEPVAWRPAFRAISATFETVVDANGIVQRTGLSPYEALSFSIVARDFPSVAIETEALEPGEVRELPEVRFAGGGELVVMARTTEGAPIGGARVTLKEHGPSGPREFHYGATAEDGQATFSGIASGLYEVEVEHGDFLQVNAQRIYVPIRAEIEVTFVMRVGEVYEGVVQFADGMPAARATVTLHEVKDANQFNFRSGRSAVTGPDGKFRIGQISMGRFLVSCSRGETWCKSSAAAELADLPRVLTLERGATLEIQLTSSTEVELAGSVRVVITTIDDEGNRIQQHSDYQFSATTSPLQIGDLQTGPRGVDVVVTGYRPIDTRFTHLVAGSVTRETFVLEPEVKPERVTLRVRVVNALSAPLRDARLNANAGVFILSPTDSGNVVELPVELGESESLRVSAPGYLPANFRNPASLAQGEEFVVVLELASILRVEIVEHDGSAPVDEPLVRVAPCDRSHSPAEMSRDEDGTSQYSLELQSGAYDLEVRDSTGLLQVETVSILPESIRDLKIVLPPVFYVRGQLRENGRPVVGGKLSIKSDDEQTFLSADVDHKGNFEARLRSAGRYEFAYSDCLRRGLHLSRTVDVSESSVVNLEWTTVCARGRLVNAQGQALPHLSGKMRGQCRYEIETDSTGAFSVSDIIPGTYVWEFDHAPADVFAHGVVEIVGADELTLMAPPLRVVAVNIFGNAGRELRIWMQQRWISIPWRTTHEPWSVSLPQGSYVVALFDYDTIAYAALTGAEPEPVTITLTAEPASAIIFDVDRVRLSEPVEVEVREVDSIGPGSVAIWSAWEQIIVRPGRFHLTLRSAGRAVHEVTITATAGAVHEVTFP